MIECPSCGMPVKKGAIHCSVCGESITGGLTGSIRSGTKRTTSLEQPLDAQVVVEHVVVEEDIPPTTNFAKSNGEPLIQTCLRCNSVLNPAAKFCSVCGRATEPTTFERTIDATRSARGRAIAAVRRAVESIRENPQAKDGLALASFICFGLSIMCFTYSFFIYPSPGPDRPDVITTMHAMRSVWWIGFGALLMAMAAFFKKS